jgi:hypothetical protein
MRYLTLLLLGIFDISGQECRAVVIPVPAGKFVSDQNWPEGLKELLDTKTRIGGSLTVSRARFEYAGGTTKFNEFLSGFSRLKVDSLHVEIHAGPRPKMADVRIDWRVTVQNDLCERIEAILDKLGDETGPAKAITSVGHDHKYQVVIHVWLSDEIAADDLRVPQNIAVTSGGEIEKFIHGHGNRQKGNGVSNKTED